MSNKGLGAELSMPVRRKQIRAGERLPEFSPAELWPILERQAALFTNLESSSVPTETAQELLESILFCIKTAAEDRGPTPGRSAGEWLLAGQRILTLRKEEGLRLQKQAERGSLPLQNPVYREVLRETGHFFTWYDIRFFAQSIPCMIDYPPALPVAEELRGVDYINEYLRRRIAEDSFCRFFPLPALQSVLSATLPGWRELPLNLFEPVFHCALGKSLLGRPPAPALLTRDELTALERLVQGWGKDEAPEQLRLATGRLCTTLHIWDSARRTYYTACAQALASRLLVARGSGLEHIFACPG